MKELPRSWHHACPALTGATRPAGRWDRHRGALRARAGARTGARAVRLSVCLSVPSAVAPTAEGDILGHVPEISFQDVSALTALPAVRCSQDSVPALGALCARCPRDAPKLPQRPQVTCALSQDGGRRLTPPGAPRPDQRWQLRSAQTPRPPCPHPTWRPLPTLLAGGRDAGAAMLSAAASRRATRAALPEAGAGPLLTTWRPRAPPREEEAEGAAAAAGGRSSLIHRTRRAAFPPSRLPPPRRPPRPLPGAMSFFRRKGRGAAGGRPPGSSPARLPGPGPAPPGIATGPREDARALRSGLPANDGQCRRPRSPAGLGGLGGPGPGGARGARLPPGLSGERQPPPAAAPRGSGR